MPITRNAARCAQILFAATALNAGGFAQLVTEQTEVLGEARAAELLGYLASDALAGRDTPSPGLDEAALFIAWTFQKSGLRPAGVNVGGPGADWFHRYELPGVQLPTAVSTLSVAGEALRPSLDFRLWSAGRPYTGEDLEFVLADAAPRGFRRSTVPSFVVVDEDHPSWRQAAGDRLALQRRVPGATPVVLVRSGAAAAFAPETTADGTLVAPRATLTVPAPVATQIPLKNVAGMVVGTERPDEFILVSAHYDHVGTAPVAGDDDVFNGADDDATGTTAVLGLAEFFSGHPQARSLLFVTFSAEEKGLRGSAAFVQNPPVPLEQILAVINIEMLGRPERETDPFVWITGESLSDLGALALPALQRAGVAKTDFEMAERLFFASDNAPFARAGVVAHSFSAGILHDDYHQVGDEFAKIDLPHLCGAVRGIAAVVEELASGGVRPAYTEAAREQLTQRRRR